MIPFKFVMKYYKDDCFKFFFLFRYETKEQTKERFARFAVINYDNGCLFMQLFCNI